MCGKENNCSCVEKKDDIQSALLVAITGNMLKTARYYTIGYVLGMFIVCLSFLGFFAIMNYDFEVAYEHTVETPQDEMSVNQDSNSGSINQGDITFNKK